ncbi:MAG: DUF1499 domain-containing protein [Deltaproteobacteria bacterium]|nr:DUF1499 domain-containing protein [Deltaproteobacteria bacterium]
MKIILTILIVLIILIVIALIVLGYSSRSGEAAGISEGRLTECPDKPNCVCSEYKNDKDHYIDPVMISAITPDIPNILKESIQETGGTIQTESREYIAATFSSSVFGFVDDLEVRIDYDKNEIHFRSASRVGHSDMGVNRKRVESIKALFYRKIK